MKNDRVAMLLLPAIGGLIVAAVLAGPGRERPVVGARLAAALTRGGSTVALRVRTVIHYRGLYRSTTAQALRAELDQHGEAIGWWQGSSDAEGIADAIVPLVRPAEGALALHVWRGGQLVAEGRVPARGPPQRLPPPAPRWGEAPVAVWAALSRGLLVPEIEERLTVWTRSPADADPTAGRAERNADAATPEAAPAAPALHWQAAGAEVRRLTDPAAPACSGGACVHRFSLGVTARATSVQLDLVARTAGGGTGRWRGELPLLAGGAWLDPSSAAAGELRVRTATPRQRVFAAVGGPAGRLWSGSVAMQDDGRGGARGRARLPALRPGPLMVLLSPDADEGRAATALWPLRPESGALEMAPLSRVADGMARAVATEEARRRAVRWPAFGLVIAIGLLELLLLWRLRASTGRDLRERLAAGSAGGEAPIDPHRIATIAGREPLWWLMVAVAAVALAFGVLAAVAAWGQR